MFRVQSTQIAFKTFKSILSNLMTKILIYVIASFIILYIFLIKTQKPSPPNHGAYVQKTITDRASSERVASTDIKKPGKGKAVNENTTPGGEQAHHPEKLSAIRKEQQSKSQIDEMSKAREDANNEFVSINSLIPNEISLYEYSFSKDLILSGDTKHYLEIETLTPDLSKKDLHASLKKEDISQRLIAIKPISHKDRCEIEIMSDSPIQRFNHFFLYSPTRLVINLFGKWKQPGESEIKPESALLKRIRLGLHPDKLRIVFDLEKDKFMKPIITESSRGIIVTIRPIA